MSVRDAVLRLAAYRLSAERAEVKLNQNESPYDLPPALKREALERVAAVPFNRYPQLQADSLRDQLATFHDWPAEGVVVTGGSNVLIQCLVIACGLGRTVLTVAPTFSVYGLEALLLDADLVEHPLEAGFALPTSALLDTMQRSSGVAFIADPAAPTGNRIADTDIAALAAASGERWTLVLDEAYVQFSESDHLELVRRNGALVSLRTFSKAFGLGGVRLGYALTSPELGVELRKVALPFGVSALQMAVASVVLEHPELVAERVAETLAERRRMSHELAELADLQVFPSAANFLLVRTPDAERVFAGLLERGVLVRRQDHLPGLSGCLRISVGMPHENDTLLGAMAAALDTLKAGAHVGSS